MKNLLVAGISAVLIWSGCSPVSQTACENKICTMEFRSVRVSFKDAVGNPVTVKDFKAINKRTRKSTVQENQQNVPGQQAWYTVASDADTKEISEKGDIITVTATNPGSGKKASADFVVTGGPCACHINKVSGPEEIVF